MFQIFLFSKKNPLWSEKRAKNLSLLGFCEYCIFYSFLHFSLSKKDFFLKIKKFGTFKCIILHLFCNTLFFVSWSLKFDFGFWLNLPVQICTIWNISILGFGPVWGFQWTNLQVQGAIFSVITRTKKIWKKNIHLLKKIGSYMAPKWRKREKSDIFDVLTWLWRLTVPKWKKNFK